MILKLSTANYKGTRDFYPEDMEIRNYLFETMKKVSRSFGYDEYDGPMIEFLELYKAKTGEEIVGKQIYNFVDKGGREVAIRPEMTPTLARMVAAKSRDLPRPIRWFSIPNLWRYEQPGHGRLREHWQLNVDLFGEDSYLAELEVIELACGILTALGAKPQDFKIKISHRKILNYFFEKKLQINELISHDLSKILDKKDKISRSEYEELLSKTDSKLIDSIKIIDEFLSLNDLEILKLDYIPEDIKSEIKLLFQGLKDLGLGESVELDTSIVRGFDYYTGFIFEIFDTNPDNKRSLFGGGRYDNLISIFNNEKLSGTGFGLGDVTLLNFIKSHNLLPEFKRKNSVYLTVVEDSPRREILNIAKRLRDLGIHCETSLTPSKLGKQISNAEKKKYNYILILGSTEFEKGFIVLKDLINRTQIEIPLNELYDKIRDLIP
jgi:histidyl-tRNA synthetase